MPRVLTLFLLWGWVFPACHGQAAPRAPAERAAPDRRFTGLDLPAPLRDLLATGRWDRTPKDFRVVALSFLADSCLAQAQADASLAEAARDCLKRCAQLAQATRPGGARQGLWLSHYTLILGAADRLGPCLDPRAHRALATALARDSLADPRFHAPSYPDKPFRWPADQAATLASLRRHDLAHPGSLAEQPIRRWRAYMLANGMDPALRLPVSEATGRAKGARAPRGCALAWQTRYLQEFAPDLAAAWWRGFRENFLVDRLLVVGFREWPRGREHPADVDSGPIIQGIGAAASALSIGAARSQGDTLLATRLEASARAATQLAGPAAKRAANTQLAAAILVLGAHVPHFP